MLRFVSKVVQKLCDLFWGAGEGVIKGSHWITGGRGEVKTQDGPKKDRIIFERSLTV